MSHPVTLSVSTLNVLLNLLVILLVAVGAEIAQYGIYKSTQLQLKRFGTAPIATEADNCFSGFKNRVFTARKSRNILNLAFVLVSASLIIGEICSEIGVNASHRCNPSHLKTSGLCAEPYDHMVSDSRMIAHAYHTRIAEWDNHEIQSFPVYEGFRKNFNGREALSHAPSKDTSRVVVAGCATSKPVKIEPYAVSLTIGLSPSVWHVIVSQVVTPNGSEPLQGFGDVTSNGNAMSAFMVVPAPDESSHARARILEYHSKNHLQQLKRNFADALAGGSAEIRNKEDMVTYNVWCKDFSHSTENFARALQVYRSVQLEDTSYTGEIVSVEEKAHTPISLMNGSDAVRAAIMLTVMNEKSCDGETFVYTECGVYDWKFIAPLLILFGFIVIFAVSNGLMVMVEKANVPVPYSSSAWSALALQHIANKEGIESKKGDTSDEESAAASRYTSSRGYYELLDGKDGPIVALRIKGIEEADEVSQGEDVNVSQSPMGQLESPEVREV